MTMMVMMTMSMIQISRSAMKPISGSMMTGKVLMTMTAANVKSATKITRTMMKTKMRMTPISKSMMTAKALMTSQHQKCNQNGDDKQDDNDQNQLDNDQTGDDKTQDDNHT